MNKSKLFQLASIAAISTLLVACDEGVTENINQDRPVYSVAEMAGLWDETYIEDNGLRNTTFTDIQPDGTFYVYDYMGDSYDTDRIRDVKDCYDKTGPYEFIKQSKNTFKDTNTNNIYNVFKVNNNYVLRFENTTDGETVYNYAYKINTQVSSLNLCL